MEGDKEIIFEGESIMAFLIGVGKHIRETHYISQQNTEMQNLIDTLSATLEETLQEIPALSDQHRKQARHLQRILSYAIREEKIPWHLAPSASSH